MALALLELSSLQQNAVAFEVDTGTNEYFTLKVGRSLQQRGSVDWVDDVYYATRLAPNPNHGLLASTRRVSIPATVFNEAQAYVQLFSYKTREGRSPAFSRVVRVPRRPSSSAGRKGAMALSAAPVAAAREAQVTELEFLRPRRVPCRAYQDVYATGASVDDALAAILKVAAPLVSKLFAGSEAKDGKPAGNTPAGNSPAGGVEGVLAQLLAALLGNSASGSAAPAAAKSLEWSGARMAGNRFLEPAPELARPFIFGIDDAILAQLIGPVVQVLPQLVSSAVQQRVQIKQADNKLMTDLLSEVNRRMLLEQLLQAQKQGRPSDTGGADPEDVNKLIALLQSSAPAAGAPAPATPAAAPAPAQVKSLSQLATPFTLSQRALLSFVHAEPVAWNGAPMALFAQGQALELRAKLTVAEPAPRTPLAKAILTLTIKDRADQSVYCQRTFKQKNLLPNALIALPLSAADLARVPAGKSLAVLLEMRWRNPRTQRESRVAGSTELALVGKYFLREQGPRVDGPRELTDMTQYRPFWNKIWEAPLLDGASGGEQRLWELDVNTRYSVLLSVSHGSNGLMETKLLSGGGEDDALRKQTSGRLKAGIELSLTELNKLLPLWTGQTPLDLERLSALQTAAFAARNAGEVVSRIPLRGRRGERGMVWAVPVFELSECKLGTVQKLNEAGQVSETAEETVRFPLPAAVRFLGLKSQRFAQGEDPDGSAARDEEAPGTHHYHFDGYDVELDRKLQLTHPGARPNGRTAS